MEMNNQDQQNFLNQSAKEVKLLVADIESSALNPEQQADQLARGITLMDENAEKTRNTVAEFVSSYKEKTAETSDLAWLEKRFSKYPELWKDSAEMKQDIQDIIKTVYDYEASKSELDSEIKKGGCRETWLAKKIEQGAAASGAVSVSSYAANIDQAVAKANESMANMITRQYDGLVSQNPNLDGFIAEQHHANSFNLDAAAKESGFYAETRGSNAPNSVDVVIKDARGGIVRKYQSKYGSDAETTQKYFDNGKYQGQRKLVPKDQTGDVSNSTDKIEYQNVSSKPLSKQEAKELQRKAQEEGEIKEYDWNDVSRIPITKRIVQKAGFSALLAVGFQGARVLGRRIWNGITGKPNKPVSEDVMEFAKSALESGASAGLTVAATGGLTVAARSGWLGNVLKATPAGRIAAAACVGVENVKILYRFAKGEITGAEALDQAGNATCSVVGSLAFGAKGAVLGASIGTALGPIGTVIGGLLGGVVGGIAGSTVGEAVYNAGKAIVKTVVSGVKSVASSVWEGIKSIGRGLAGIFGF